MTLKCFKCSAEVVFDAEHIGKNGKKIPLDPTTKQPHDCPMRESLKNIGTVTQVVDRRTEEEKDDHGKEEEWGNPIPIPNAVKPNKTEYVDHTLKGQSRVIIFYGRPDNVAEEYNTFLSKNNGKLKTQGAQFQTAQQDDGSVLFAIALYYEEVAK